MTPTYALNRSTTMRRLITTAVIAIALVGSFFAGTITKGDA